MINSVFNYTGNKFKLLDQILPLFDYEKKYFVDIFAGGGSVWSNVIDKFDKILVNDIIKDLIDIQRLLYSDPEHIIKLTKDICVGKDDKEGFLSLRKSYNENKSPEKLWALILSCTNNMIRFNKKIEFNQTYGKRTWNDNTTKKVNKFVEHISNYDNVIFISKNFYDINIKKPTMVYLDPPYLESEAGYNNYWSKELDKKLYNYIINLDKNGSSFALSGIIGEHKNGKRSKLIDMLIHDGFNYKILDFDYEKVARNKNIKNSKEVLIYNYSK